MPEVLDWQRGEPRLVLQRAVDELTAGNLVVFPTGTGYHIAASAVNPAALAALGRLALPETATLAVRDLADALHWAPQMSRTACRLARRVWPGPVTLVVDCAAQDDGTEVGPNRKGTVHLCVPAHQAPMAALQLLPGPLVLIPVRVGASSVAELAAVLGNFVALIIDDGPPSNSMAPTIVRVNASDWNVIETGSVTPDMLRALMPTTVLFVCTGNTCRSPMAEALCKKLLADRLGCEPAQLPERGFVVVSAGLAAMMGADASPEAALAVSEHGGDLTGHRSQPLSTDLLACADHLFTMTQNHLRVLASFCPEGQVQPRLLAKDGQDVPDPIGSEPEVYRECAQQILRYLQERLPDIQPL